MKTPEDEAFDDLAKRQGDWGGGFQAKRAAAADKQKPAQEPVAFITNGGTGELWWSRSVDEDGNPNAKDIPLYTTPPQRTEQEQPLPPVEIGVDVTADGASVVAFYRRPNAVMEMFYSQFHPAPKRPWVGLTPEETSGFTSQEMTVVKYVSKVLQEKNT